MGADHASLTPRSTGSTRHRDPHPLRRWWWIGALVIAQKLLFLVLLADQAGRRWYWSLFKWDGFFYVHIARDWYQPGQPVDGKIVRNDLAFFPLYPLAGRVVAALPGLGVRPALLVVSWASFLLAVWGLYRLGEELHSQRFGALLALAWAVVPRSFLQVMAYSEGMFTALSVWALVALARGRWWTAAVLCALAGATRSTGAATFVAVGGTLGVLFLQRLVRTVRGREPGQVAWVRGGVPMPSWGTLVGAACVGAMGTALSLAHVVWRAGSWDAYLAIQKEWGMSMGNPAATLDQWWVAVKIPGLWRYVSLKLVVVALPIWTVLMALALWVVRHRPRWRPAVVHSLVLFVLMACAQAYFNSKERYLLPAVGCLLPVALLGVRVFDARRERARSLGTGLLVAAWLVAAICSALIGAMVVARSGISP